MAKRRKPENADAELRRSNELAALRQVVNTPAGRDVLWRLIEFCGIYVGTGVTDGGALNRREGARNVGLFLIAEIDEAEPGAYGTMMLEHKDGK